VSAAAPTSNNRKVADTAAVPLPAWSHCEIDRDGTDFVLLRAELSSAVPGDQTDTGTAVCRRAGAGRFLLRRSLIAEGVTERGCRAIRELGTLHLIRDQS
jgi:hypothetical protein